MNANGLYSGLDGGAVNGVYNGVNGGVGNGAISNEIYRSSNFLNICRRGLVLNLDAGIRSSYIGSGVTWNDLTANANVATLFGPVFNTLNQGYLMFDGINDYADIQSSSSYKPQFPVSLSVFFKLNTLPSTLYYLIKTDNPSNSNHSGVEITISPTSINAAFGNNTGNTASGRRTYTATQTLVIDTWYNITAVFPDNTSCVIYLNEKPLTTSFTSGGGTTLVYAGSPASIGYRIDAIPSYFLNGNISNVMIYNSTLTVAEVTQNYLALKSRYNL